MSTEKDWKGEGSKKRRMKKKETPKSKYAHIKEKKREEKSNERIEK